MFKAFTAAAASGLVLAFLAPLPAAAAVVKGSGIAIYTVSPIAEAMVVGDGRKLEELHMKGVLHADSPRHPFDLSIQDCNDVALVDSDNAALRDYGTCAAMDRAGDVWWMRFTRHGRAGTWAVIGGTGKYRGMTGSGTLHDDLVTPDGRVQLTWQGKVEMKAQ